MNRTCSQWILNSLWNFIIFQLNTLHNRISIQIKWYQRHVYDFNQRRIQEIIQKLKQRINDIRKKLIKWKVMSNGRDHNLLYFNWIETNNIFVNCARDQKKRKLLFTVRKLYTLKEIELLLPRNWLSSLTTTPWRNWIWMNEQIMTENE